MTVHIGETFLDMDGFSSNSASSSCLALFSQLEQPGELMGSVSFQKAIEQSNAFKRLEQFTMARLNKNESFDYQTIEDQYYENLHDYRLVNHENTFSLAKKHGVDHDFKVEDTLDEHFYILEKT